MAFGPGELNGRIDCSRAVNITVFLTVEVGGGTLQIEKPETWQLRFELGRRAKSTLGTATSFVGTGMTWLICTVRVAGVKILCIGFNLCGGGIVSYLSITTGKVDVIPYCERHQ